MLVQNRLQHAIQQSFIAAGVTFYAVQRLLDYRSKGMHFAPEHR